MCEKWLSMKNRSTRRSTPRHPITMASTAKHPDPMPCALVAILLPEAMVRGGAEYQVQEAMNHSVANWGKTFLRDTNAGLRSISQAASMGVQGDLMSNERWGRECMLQLQEDENWNKPTATTWAAEFLLRGGESREILGSWIRSGKVPEAKKRRVNQVITCSFPCGKWLHRIGSCASPKCELCRRERETRGASVDSLPQETVAAATCRRKA